MIEWLVKMKRVQSALATALTFACYTRPSETLRIRVQDTVPPPLAGAMNLRQWSIVLHPSEGETCSKTGEFDESLVLNSPEFKWLESFLRQRRRDLDGTQALFDLSYVQWARDFKDAGDALGLAALGP